MRPAGPVKDVEITKRPRYEEIVDEINALPGMKTIKEQVGSLVSQALFNKASIAHGMDIEPLSGNMVLIGNAGTGKTTVTRKLGQLMHELGMTSSPEVVQLTRADLVGPFANTSAQTTFDKITGNRGKVIFIDEAYALYNGPNDLEGRQVLDELMRLSEEYRDDTSIVLAGYGPEMTELFEANQGLNSRFSNKLHLRDYTPAEKRQVMNYMVETNNRTFSNRAAKRRAGQYAAALPSAGAQGNARAVRNFYDVMRSELARRITAGDIKSITAKDLATFTLDDVEAAAARMELPPPVVRKRTSPKAAANKKAAQQRVASKPRRLRAVVEEPAMAGAR